MTGTFEYLRTGLQRKRIDKKWEWTRKKEASELPSQKYFLIKITCPRACEREQREIMCSRVKLSWKCHEFLRQSEKFPVIWFQPCKAKKNPLDESGRAHLQRIKFQSHRQRCWASWREGFRGEWESSLEGKLHGVSKRSMSTVKKFVSSFRWLKLLGRSLAPSMCCNRLYSWYFLLTFFTINSNSRPFITAKDFRLTRQSVLKFCHHARE